MIQTKNLCTSVIKMNMSKTQTVWQWKLLILHNTCDAQQAGSMMSQILPHHRVGSTPSQWKSETQRWPEWWTRETGNQTSNKTGSPKLPVKSKVNTKTGSPKQK